MAEPGWDVGLGREGLRRDPSLARGKGGFHPPACGPTYFGKRPSIPDLPVQRGRMNSSITLCPREGMKHGKSHAQDAEHHPRAIPPSPKQLPLSCSTPARRVPTQSPSQQPVPRAGSPWGQHSLPKIISDIWDHTSFAGVLMSGAQGLTDFFFFYSSS